MSTGSQNEHTTQQTPPLHPPSSSSSPNPPPRSSDVTHQVLLLLSNADDKTLREVICHCRNVMNSRPDLNVKKLAEQFTVFSSVLSEPHSETVEPTTNNIAGSLMLSFSNAILPDPSENFTEQLTEELETLGLREKSGAPGKRKVSSQWLIKSPQQTNLPSEDLDKFPQISRLRSIVSGLTDGSDFNSCIVNFYADGAARTRPHADDESYIDQSCPIACFSIGQTREIGIFDKNDGQLVGKHSLQTESLLIMKPGAQANTKHQLLPMRSGPCGERYSISFRKIKYTEVQNEWPFTNKTSAIPPKPTPPPQKNKTTLVLGTSIPYYLDFQKLTGSSGKVNVINLCQRGAKIRHLHDVLDEHYKNANPDESVDKIIVSVGTNDLRNNKKNTVGHLYTPMENLVSKIKTFYPEATIYIQSLLPLRVQNAFTVGNVLGFNKLLVRLSAQNKCFYLDIFEEFLGENKHINPDLYRWDGVHLSNKGLSVLARAFIAKIRGRFNPVTRA